MKRETVIYTVNQNDKDIEFKLEFTMLSTPKSLKFLMYMGKIIGGGAGKVLGALDGVGGFQDLINLKEDELNLGKLGDALFSLFDRMDEDEVLQKLNLLLSSVRHNGTELDLEYFMFEGRPDLALKVAFKALGVNYKRFLGESSGLFQKIKETVLILQNTKKSQAKETQTGSSGDQ